MSDEQGVEKQIKTHLLRILDGKICSEVNRLINTRAKEIYGPVLKSIFSEDYKNEIYNTYLESVLATFDPANYEVDILEGIDKTLKRTRRPNANVTRKYIEARKKQRKNRLTILGPEPAPLELTSVDMKKEFLKLKERKLAFKPLPATRKKRLSTDEKANLAYEIGDIISGVFK